MAYRFKVRKGNSQLAEKDFYVGRITNDRIMSKRETYQYLDEEVGGSRAASTSTAATSSSGSSARSMRPIPVGTRTRTG